MSTPLVSTITACFNDGRYLPTVIDSIRASDYPNIEIIIVDDGSTDPDTLALLNTLSDEPDITVLQIAHVGLSDARNHAIEAATGHYIQIIDADDTLEPTCIRRSVDILIGDPRVSLVGSFPRFVGELNYVEHLEAYTPWRHLISPVTRSCIAFRRSDWEQVGGYCSGLQWADDWEFSWRLLRIGNVHTIREPLWNYLTRPGQLTKTTPLESRRFAQQHIVRTNLDIVDTYANEFVVMWRGVSRMAAHFVRRYGWLDQRRSQDIVVGSKPTELPGVFGELERELAAGASPIPQNQAAQLIRDNLEFIADHAHMFISEWQRRSAVSQHYRRRYGRLEGMKDRALEIILRR